MNEKNLTDMNGIDSDIEKLCSELINDAKGLSKENIDIFYAKLDLLKTFAQIKRGSKNRENISDIPRFHLDPAKQEKIRRAISECAPKYDIIPGSKPK